MGTISRGIRAPIIRKGDDICSIVTDSVLSAAAGNGFSIGDRDIIAVTEAVVARAQGNYATVAQIAADIRHKFNGKPLGVIFPILSRNRFAVCLRGIAAGSSEIVLMLSYPSDEVGNHLISQDQLDEKNVNPWSDLLPEEKFRELFGYNRHTFTGIDYIEYYKGLITSCGCKATVIFANNAKAILNYTGNVLCCDIHTRTRTKRILEAAGAEKVLCLDEILSSSVDGSGYNEDFGLLGSNKATEESVKLFPRACRPIVESIQKKIKDRTGKDVEVMVYGDGAFKDPVGKIWELADPVVSPAYTSGLEGVPNEVKLKYLADNDFAALNGKDLEDAICSYIAKKGSNLVGNMNSQGTTPRRLTDLIGSLCDLTSGSGDKGTPIVLVQGYFDNFSK